MARGIKVPQSCPKAARQACVQNGNKSERVRPSWGIGPEHCPKFGKPRWAWAKVGQIAANVLEGWPKSTIGRVWPDAGQVWPKLGQIGPKGQNRQTLGKNRDRRATSQQLLDNFGGNFGASVGQLRRWSGSSGVIFRGVWRATTLGHLKPPCDNRRLRDLRPERDSGRPSLWTSERSTATPRSTSSVSPV